MGADIAPFLPSADVRMFPAVAKFGSDDGCDLLEAQPRAPGKELLEVAVADVDEYVRPYPAVREERGVDGCIVETAHGTRIQPKGTKCHDEVGDLQGSVLVGGVIGERFIADEPALGLGVWE